MVDFVDPTYTSQICGKCGKFVGRTSGEIFKCPFCGLSINVHENAAINIRNRSEVYQKIMNEDIYQRLTRDMKEKIKISEERLRSLLSPEVYTHRNQQVDNNCWSKRISDNQKISNRDAIARIYAFGEVTYTHMETYEQATSMSKETLSNMKGEECTERSSIQAPPAYR